MADGSVEAYLDHADEALYEILGAELLGSGMGVSPAELDRYRRFARSWLDNKTRQLKRSIENSETYRLWRQSAADDDTGDPGLLKGILEQQGYDGEAAAALAVLLDRTARRDRLANEPEEYDIAVSFAAEQRAYVAETVAQAKSLGLRVFYDRDMAFEWWGRNFITEQRKVFARGALFFVPFLSTEYLARPVPRDEFSHAMIKATEQGDHYILPVLIGKVVVPSELLSPHIGYLRADEHSPAQLAAMMWVKVDGARLTPLKD